MFLLIAAIATAVAVGWFGVLVALRVFDFWQLSVVLALMCLCQQLWLQPEQYFTRHCAVKTYSD